MSGYPFEPLVDVSDPQVMRERARAMTTAAAGYYFWLPCPLCGLEFGGHEWMQGSADKPSSVHLESDPPGVSTGICPYCTMAGRGAEYRPATMLQPVTFDDSPGEAMTVRMVPVDESADDW